MAAAQDARVARSMESLVPLGGRASPKRSVQRDDKRGSESGSGFSSAYGSACGSACGGACGGGSACGGGCCSGGGQSLSCSPPRQSVLHSPPSSPSAGAVPGGRRSSLQGTNLQALYSLHRVKVIASDFF